MRPTRRSRAPFSKEASPPAYLEQIKAVFRRHPNATIIWAHTGMGRIVRPVQNHATTVEEILRDPALSHVHFDISWDEVAKYVVSTPEATRITADLTNSFPDRFLFGSDEVAPTAQEKYLKVFYQYGPWWDLLSKDAVQKVRKGNYERIFDQARLKVRAWEKTNVSGAGGEGSTKSAEAR